MFEKLFLYSNNNDFTEGIFGLKILIHIKQII